MKNIWDAFIENSNNGTMFHKQSFLSYHINKNFKDFSLLFYHKRQLLCVLPAALLLKNNSRQLVSHPGASFGGFVLRSSIAFQLIQNIIECLEKYLSKRKINFIHIIITPNIYFNHRDESLLYLLKWNQYQIYETYISHFMTLGKGFSLQPLIQKRKRRYIVNLLKKKTFSIVPSNNFKDFYSILCDSKKQYNSKPTHSLEELIKLKQLFKNKVMLYVTTKQNIVVGGTLIFFLNQTVCLIFYNVIKKEYRGSHLASLQLYNAIKVAQEKKYSIVDFGVSHQPEKENPLIPKFSLIHFKEQFSSRGCMRIVLKKELI